MLNLGGGSGRRPPKNHNMQKTSTSRTSLLNRSQVVRVRFPASSVSGGETDFIFGSLAAVFDMFSEDEVGVKLQTLYSVGMVADGLPFTSPTGVEFKKLTLYRKRQTKKS